MELQLGIVFGLPERASTTTMGALSNFQGDVSRSGIHRGVGCNGTNGGQRPCNNLQGWAANRHAFMRVCCWSSICIGFDHDLCLGVSPHATPREACMGLKCKIAKVGCTLSQSGNFNVMSMACHPFNLASLPSSKRSQWLCGPRLPATRQVSAP